MKEKKHKSYMIKFGDGQYQVYHWSNRSNCYYWTQMMDYWRARIAVGVANCRNPKTCTKETHDHSWDDLEFNMEGKIQCK